MIDLDALQRLAALPSPWDVADLVRLRAALPQICVELEAGRILAGACEAWADSDDAGFSIVQILAHYRTVTETG